ncbi:MAG: phosphoribosylanthranilate isomerase [Synergistaceae bacterium]|nr:phosphoribosylanthranilate isomerase [Synergistaceae bacterium]
MRPAVKICGLMRPEDAQMCVRLGADILGFVVDYPRPVPWNLSAAAAKDLMAAVGGRAETCIVTGGRADKILSVATDTKPNYVQLHFRETLPDTMRLAFELGKSGIKIIKTLFPDTPDLEKTAADFCAAGVHALLFDPRTPDNAIRGGVADISVFNKLKHAVSCPVILAGGITPVNAAELVLQSGARIIDLMTGVEHSPGVKDETKVAALFRALGN